jgi:transcriptional regulator with XRE-family HTH domain
VAGQPAPDFGGLLQQLRAEAGLTQEELAQAAGLSPRTVSDLERGVHRSAHQDTARLLAEGLGLAGPVRGLFVAAARGRVPAAEVLAARSGLPRTVGGPPGHQADVERLLGAVIDSPYCGLNAFEELDAGFFFGREAATIALLDRMSHQSRDAGLLVVSGASGAGKTSLLRAGVLPRIRKGGLAAAPGAASWPQLVLTPTGAPLDELALRVGLLAAADAAAVRRSLDADPDGFTLTVRQAALALAGEPVADPEGLAAGRDRQRLLLVVDQFEQLFTLCADEAQRLAFIAALHATATGRHGPGQTPAAQVVLVVRADFEARCAGYPQLTEAVHDRYPVTALTGRQLRMAITEPAKKAGSALDADLVEVLLAEAQPGRPGESGAGALPFLSHALDQAWRCRTGLTVTLAEYERVGGMERVVAESAQRAYERLSAAGQAAARHVFTRLIAIGGDGGTAAGHVGKADLTEGKSAAQARDVTEALEAFANRRLLTLAADGVAISHEVVLAAWPLLRDTWLADIQADRIVRTRLHHTAAEWARHSRDPSYLYGGSLLKAASGMAARVSADPARYAPLSQAERDFLTVSDRARRHRKHRRRAFFALLGAVVIASSAVAVLAVNVIREAPRQRANAISQLLISQSRSNDAIDPALARLQSVWAWRLDPSPDARYAMLAAARLPIATLQNRNGPVAFSPDSRLLASDNTDLRIGLWNVAGGQPKGRPFADGGRVVSVAFRPDGNILATGSVDGAVQLWNVVNHQPTGPLLPSHRGQVYAVAFSPHDGTLASGGEDGTVQFWNAAGTAGRPIAGHHGPIYSVAYSPRSDTLATGSVDGAVQLWNAATHGQIAILRDDTGAVYSIAFSPNGVLLAASGADRTVRLWDVNGPVENSLADSSGAFLARHLCATARVGLTRAAWAHLRQDYQKACL